MELPFLGDPFEDVPREWREVPVYRGIKRVVGPWIEEGFGVHGEGLSNVPETGAVVASNHASWFDPLFIGAALDRPVHWMAKAELFRHPLTDAFFKRAGQIKVDRVSGGNEAAVQRCIELVGRDRLVGIFPEGSRSIDGSLRRGRTGVARIALRSGKPIVPLAMNSYDILPKHARMPDLDQPLVLQVGEPLEYGASEDPDPQVCRKITDDVMAEIGRLLEQARTRREALVYEEGG